VTVAVGQLRPTAEGASEPLTVRHDDVTVQVPATSPEHAVTFEHETLVPPLPLDDEPPLPPPAPVVPPWPPPAPL
jgi:hypothetical protein